MSDSILFDLLNNLEEKKPSLPVVKEDATANDSIRTEITLQNQTTQVIASSPSFHNKSEYPGDIIDESGPLEDTGFRALEFPNPALMLAFYIKDITEGFIKLHPWQIEQHKQFGEVKPTSQHPYKLCLITCNGSGKDSIIIAGFAVWFALCKVRSRCIITSSSGVQLTSQTETYIKDVALAVNSFHGCEIFRIRQRYIKCMLSGSEIRLFATDEKGKAEGYHPWGRGEMAIIVNEGKTVTDDIHNALKRCTGFNYWLEISSPGEPSGYFYRSATSWQYVRRVTSYDCPHLSMDEIEEDKREWGEFSALFRSKHLALFTSLGGEVIITQELIDSLLKDPPKYAFPSLRKAVGIDLAAGGDENVVSITQGNKCIKEVWFRETDTEITAFRIDEILRTNQISKDHEYIYADDGGIGHAIIDKLVRMGWKINRVLNQWAAINKRNFGNRGAENWYRIKRIIEERFFDVSTVSEKTREQLYTRHYKQTATGGRIFLESKKEAKANGRLSPDRADALILSMTGLTIDTFMDTKVAEENPVKKYDGKPLQEALTEYVESVQYGNYKETSTGNKKKIFNSLKAAIRN